MNASEQDSKKETRSWPSEFRRRSLQLRYDRTRPVRHDGIRLTPVRSYQTNDGLENWNTAAPWSLDACATVQQFLERLTLLEHFPE
jgi:hypothetical protein